MDILKILAANPEAKNSLTRIAGGYDKNREDVNHPDYTPYEVGEKAIFLNSAGTEVSTTRVFDGKGWAPIIEGGNESLDVGFELINEESIYADVKQTKNTLYKTETLSPRELTVTEGFSKIDEITGEVYEATPREFEDEQIDEFPWYVKDYSLPLNETLGSPHYDGKPPWGAAPKSSGFTLAGISNNDAWLRTPSTNTAYIGSDTPPNLLQPSNPVWLNRLSSTADFPRGELVEDMNQNDFYYVRVNPSPLQQNMLTFMSHLGLSAPTALKKITVNNTQSKWGAADQPNVGTIIHWSFYYPDFEGGFVEGEDMSQPVTNNPAYCEIEGEEVTNILLGTTTGLLYSDYTDALGTTDYAGMCTDGGGTWVESTTMGGNIIPRQQELAKLEYAPNHPIAGSDIMDTLYDVFRHISEVCDITFINVPASQDHRVVGYGELGEIPQMRISTTPIPGGALADASYPKYGDIRIDSSSKWGVHRKPLESSNQFCLYSVVLHEVLHAIGIPHQPSCSSVLFPYASPASFSDGQGLLTLSEGDITTLQLLYGPAKETDMLVTGSVEASEFLDKKGVNILDVLDVTTDLKITGTSVPRTFTQATAPNTQAGVKTGDCWYNTANFITYTASPISDNVEEGPVRPGEILVWMSETPYAKISPPLTPNIGEE